MNALTRTLSTVSRLTSINRSIHLKNKKKFLLMINNMSDSSDFNAQLPPGWESRYDIRSRRQYYVDNYNRTTTWDDPRPRYRTLLQQTYQGSPSHSFRQGEMTPLQHGSLEFRGYNTVYPSYSSYPPPPQPAFQLLPTPYSHLAPNSSLYQEMNILTRPSPILSRAIGTVMGANAFQQRSHHFMETSLTSNTDELVAKIGANFPTVSETHIRCLLKKYHNREAVVVSALQVEKHPIATPGPFSTPPLARNILLPGSQTPFQMTPPLSIRATPSISIRSNMATPPLTIRGNVGTPPLGIRGSPPTRGGSPVPRPGSSASSYYSSSAFGDYRQSPKPQSSPKMKLRYLKSVFPKAEETVLLDTLISENNNVMKTAEKLKMMGFEKKDMGKSKLLAKKKEEEMSAASILTRRALLSEEMETQKPTPPPRMKSLEEKNKMKSRLEGLYSDIPERLIQIAIESVDYDEEKARHLLMLMVNEEKENKNDNKVQSKIGDTTDGKTKTVKTESGGKEAQKGKKDEDKRKEMSEKSKPKKDVPKVSRGTSTTEDKEFKSPYLSKIEGRNAEFRKGPNDQLLLADYMTWNGPNPELRTGRDKTLAEGPNKNYLSEARFAAKGPSKENRKGPILGLAKGSIYSQITLALTEARLL